MRVLVKRRDVDGDWCVSYDAKVVAVTTDGKSMKLKRLWWYPAYWLPVDGLFVRLVEVKE